MGSAQVNEPEPVPEPDPLSLVDLDPSLIKEKKAAAEKRKRAVESCYGEILGNAVLASIFSLTPETVRVDPAVKWTVSLQVIPVITVENGKCTELSYETDGVRYATAHDAAKGSKPVSLSDELAIHVLKQAEPAVCISSLPFPVDIRLVGIFSNVWDLETSRRAYPFPETTRPTATSAYEERRKKPWIGDVLERKVSDNVADDAKSSEEVPDDGMRYRSHTVSVEHREIKRCSSRGGEDCDLVITVTRDDEGTCHFAGCPITKTHAEHVMLCVSTPTIYLASRIRRNPVLFDEPYDGISRLVSDSNAEHDNTDVHGEALAAARRTYESFELFYSNDAMCGIYADLMRSGVRAKTCSRPFPKTPIAFPDRETKLRKHSDVYRELKECSMQQGPDFGELNVLRQTPCEDPLRHFFVSTKRADAVRAHVETTKRAVLAVDLLSAKPRVEHDTSDVRKFLEELTDQRAKFFSSGDSSASFRLAPIVAAWTVDTTPVIHSET